MTESDKPLTGYHGTKSVFTKFDPRKFGKSDPGLVGRAIYLSPSGEQASEFATSPHYGKGDAPNVMPFHVHMKNPYIIHDGRLPDGRRLTDIHPQGITKHSGEAIRKEIMGKGHDGVIFRLGGEDTQYAVFHHKNITPKFGKKESNSHVLRVLGVLDEARTILIGTAAILTSLASPGPAHSQWLWGPYQNQYQTYQQPWSQPDTGSQRHHTRRVHREHTERRHTEHHEKQHEPTIRTVTKIVHRESTWKSLSQDDARDFIKREAQGFCQKYPDDVACKKPD